MATSNDNTPAPVVPQLPTSGGSYIMNADGSLTPVQQPSAPAPAAATYPTPKE